MKIDNYFSKDVKEFKGYLNSLVTIKNKSIRQLLVNICTEQFHFEYSERVDNIKIIGWDE